ncbi:OmpA family protein [Patiriisocius hiemis]|uniref:OmpA family protein n=1 Tax=Patiriisocius hiemis TaxID=3075604 RepID=A0ABU2YB69_9FLAO|nr:OmpA family protein [Constantimarinum sp. W242]MDT0555436.1 OmpA family protein [Constantimarinum sp. W242]
MKNIYTLIILIALGTLGSNAQNSTTKKADELYERLQYTDAIEAYQKLLKRGEGSRYVFKQLGNSYYYINDTKKAESFYKRVVKARNVSPETVYNYAQSLKANGKVGDYNTWMRKFAEAKPNDSRAIDFMKNPDYIPQLMDQRQRYDAKPLKDINTSYSEFGGFMAGKDFYFSSARNTLRRSYGWDDQPFLDIYKASDVGGTIKNADLLDGDINTKFHEGNVAITADGKRMYFDRNDYFNKKYDKSEEGINQINLYYAELVDGRWTGVESVAFNSDEYSTGHPALSPDGKTLYFVSDMPGGKGLSDIYKVAISEDGILGTPQRLSDAVNTEGKEVFPYLDGNGTLYFSSDGHLGLGLLDVFYAEAAGSGFSNPVNMGMGVNSTEDDFAFKFNEATKTGFVSSNRKGGKGSDDIYAISEIEYCDVVINVKVVNDYTDEPINGARVDVYDTSENNLGNRSTNSNGMAFPSVECGKAHLLQAFMKGFEPNSVEVDASSGGTMEATIRLRPIDAIIEDDRIVLEPIYFDLDKHNIKPKAAFELDKVVQIMNKYPKMKIKVESHTDIRATPAYNLALSNRRAQSTIQYLISKGIDKSRLEAEGKGESNPKIDCGSNCTEAQHQENRRSDFIIIER